MEAPPAVENMERLTGKNIVVTGGTGFVGSHLIEVLVRLRANVIVPYRSCDPRSYFFTQKLDKKTVMVQCDIKDFQRVFDVVTKYEPDFIFHLAAQSIVPTAYRNPLETLETNIMGTAHILEAARLYGNIQGIIVASSDKAYGKSSKAYTETDSLHGDHPYEVSKSSEDLLAQTYYRTYGLPIVITRFGNIYGEGDINFNRLIPGIMRNLVKHTPIDIRSDGTYQRDYVYVGDVVNAYVLLLERLPKIRGEVFNISSHEHYSVFELITLTKRIMHKKVTYSIKNVAHNEIPNQHLDYTKISKLGFRNKYSYHGVAKRIYQWYRSMKRYL